MGKLVCFLFLAVFCYAVVAVTKNDVYKMIHRIGEEVRQNHTAEMRRNIGEAILQATDNHKKACINSQISVGYKTLNTDLGRELNALRKEFKAMPMEDVEAMTPEQVEQQVHDRAWNSVSSFSDKLQNMIKC